MADTEKTAQSMNAKSIGSGKITLLQAHGFGADQTIWDDILSDLGQQYHVVVFNWDFSAAITAKEPAYNALSRQLIRLMKEMGLNELVSVGHSMAGMMGCLTATDRPDLFLHLVLIGASARYVDTEGYIGGITMMEVEKILTMIEQDFNSWASSFAGIMVGDAAMAARLSKTLQGMNPHVALSLAKTVFLRDFRGILNSVKVPCSVINGSRDPIVPKTAADFLQQNLEGNTALIVLDFEGHFPQLTVPKLLVDTLNFILGP